MKNTILTLLAMACTLGLKSQGTEGFENVTLDSGKVLNGKSGETSYMFQSNLIKMPVFYDTSFGGFWSSGWAISRKYDSTTIKSNAGRHLYCAKTFKGINNSNTFAVGQNGSYFTIDQGGGFRISHFYLTNSTYTFNSMKFGDLFGKKFGGKTGKDADYLFVRIKTYLMGSLKDSQDIYLADFRSSDSTKDFILKDWVRVDIPTFMADSFTFTMNSSDTGSFGMNTPGFFVLDDIAYDRTENVTKLANGTFQIYPNPATDRVNLNFTESVSAVSIFDLQARCVLKKEVNARQFILETNQLSNGLYQVQIQTRQGIISNQLIINR